MLAHFFAHTSQKANRSVDLNFQDVVSYNMEQAKGHGNVNILTVIMKSKGINLQSALDFAGGYFEALTTQVNEVRGFLASHKDSIYSQDALRVLDGYGDWVRGNNEYVALYLHMLEVLSISLFSGGLLSLSAILVKITLRSRRQSFLN